MPVDPRLFDTTNGFSSPLPVVVPMGRLEGDPVPGEESLNLYNYADPAGAINEFRRNYREKRDQEIATSVFIGLLILGVLSLLVIYRSAIFQKLKFTMPVSEKSKSQTTTNKADQLRELKKLLDENIITTDEFELEKKKVLSS